MIDGRTYKPYLLAFTFHQRFHTLHDPHNPVFGRRLSRAFQLESCLCVARPILIVSALQKISSRSVMNYALRGSKFTTTWMRLSKINRSCLSLHKGHMSFLESIRFSCWQLLFDIAPCFFNRRRHRSCQLSGARRAPCQIESQRKCQIVCQNICQKRCQRL